MSDDLFGDLLARPPALDVSLDAQNDDMDSELRAPREVYGRLVRANVVGHDYHDRRVKMTEAVLASLRKLKASGG